MNKMRKNDLFKSYRPKLLATSIAAVCTSMIATSVTQASDIDIYQQAKAGDITLMMMLDISTSMNGGGTARTDLGLTSTDCSGSNNSSSSLPNYGYSRTYCTVSSSQFNTLSTGNATNRAKAAKITQACNIQGNGSYFCGDRTARMKDAMYELLNGSVTKGIAQLDDTKVVGLSTFGVRTNNDYAEGAILLPARALGEMIGTQTHRQLLTQRVQGLNGITYTPTAYGYAEVINYIMGTRPDNNSLNRGFNNSDISTKTGTGTSQRYNMPGSLVQTNDTQECSGQGIYVLTDGVPNSKHALTQNNMRIGLGDTNFSCNTSNNWDCQHKGARALINKNNPLGLEVRTAVVGFGDLFETVTSFDRNKTQAENIAAIGGCTLNGGCDTDAKNAAYWGIVGGGGWYSGSSSQDVVDSVNEFLNSLGTTIPAVTTGSPTVPPDALNPSILRKDAYYPQFQPTPDKSHQLWLGNMKKYLVHSTGKLVDKLNNAIVDSQGRIVDNYDRWSPDVQTAVENADENTYGSIKYAQRGGAWSQLKLRTVSGAEQRKVLTNRVASGTGAAATFGNGSNLRRVDLDDLTDATYSNDPNRGYLISLLGYDVDAANPSTINTTSLATANELRQVGAVMHSAPVLVTNEGRITYNATTKTLDSTNREDYVLFGSTQGLLHVVDAISGEEKFAFVPNEMVENQKQAFVKPDATTGGTNKLFYGVDAPWVVYSEYVIDSSGKLTVGVGKNSLKGKQYAYGGLRMGGRSYYALDLSNINSPELKFQINPSADTTGALSHMGQSWSKPTIAWVNWGGKRKQVMFVGGGYDAGGVDGDARDASGVKIPYAGYESDTYNQTNGIGAGVYMFDAENGELLFWSSKHATTSAVTENGANAVIGHNDADMQYSVPSEIRTVDRDGDDLVDHLYFGDLGGQVFRIDLDNKAVTKGGFVKHSQRILDLNTGAHADKRPRFYDMPSFSIYNHAGETFAVISVGSGNRSSPLKDYTTGTSGYEHDAIYNVYDKDVARKDLYTYTTGGLYTQNVAKAAMGEVTNSNRNDYTTLVAPYSTGGWYYRFQSNKLQSEKVFGTPLAMNFQLFVSTFDGSKPGLSGDCGAGVKGESYMNRFCLPFGQCKPEFAGTGGGDPTCTDASCDKSKLGPGIHTGTVVGGEPPPPCTGPSCTPPPRPGSGENYCVSTGGRMPFNPHGGTGLGEQTSICLIPNRWYEKFR